MPTKVTDYASLRRAAQKARARGVSKAVLPTAKELLDTWVITAERHDVPLPETLRRLRDGAAARQISTAMVEAQVAGGQGIVATAACRSGCAFCCILNGADGGTIGADEARRLHAALAPHSGEPDGREWHPDACPALDPETRLCRAYEERPLICRTYMSTDAEACRTIAGGTPASGTGVLRAQLVHLAILAISRSILTGTAMVRTFALSEIAAQAVAGQPLEIAMKRAAHPPSGLTEELARQSEGMG